MTDKTVRLHAFKADYVVDFLRRHPVDWCKGESRLAGKGDVADKCGTPPSATVPIFLDLVGRKRDLVTHDELWAEVTCRWREAPRQAGRFYFADLSQRQQRALEVKNHRNFYPSLIDSLHLHALLLEHGAVDGCMLDSEEDVHHSTDLLVRLNGVELRVAHRVDTKGAAAAVLHKILYRGKQEVHYEMVLTMNRSKSAGDKRWYLPSDVEQMLAALSLHAPRLKPAVDLPRPDTYQQQLLWS